MKQHPVRLNAMEQYSLLARQPARFALCDVCSRAALIASLVGIWVLGGLLTVPHARWLMSAPASLTVALCAIDLLMCRRLGPAAWAVHKWGRFTACAIAICAVHLLASPIVLRVHPYGSFFAHVVGCALVAACTVPQLHMVVLAAAALSPQGLGVLQLDVYRHVLFQASVRAFRLVDCATGV